jgi:hypothetical protein
VLVYDREVIVVLNLFTISGAYNGSEKSKWDLKMVIYSPWYKRLCLPKTFEDPSNWVQPIVVVSA